LLTSHQSGGYLHPSWAVGRAPGSCTRMGLTLD